MTAKSKMNSFDAAALDTVAACNKPADVEIRHPATNVPTGIVISVLGKDSDVYRSRIRAMADENIRRSALGKAGDVTLDRLEQRNIDALVAATVAWRTGDVPTITLHGEALDCTPANARRIYTEILPIRDQVSEAINDLGNFMAS